MLASTKTYQTLDMFAILAGGLIKSNLSRIPPNPHRYRSFLLDSFKKEVIERVYGIDGVSKGAFINSHTSSSLARVCVYARGTARRGKKRNWLSDLPRLFAFVMVHQTLCPLMTNNLQLCHPLASLYCHKLNTK